MFRRWGALTYRFRHLMVILAVGLAAASLPLAAGVSAALSAGGWLDPGSESSVVAERLSVEFGGGRSDLIAVFRAEGAAGVDATSAAFQGAIAQTLAALRADPRVTGIVGYAQTGDRRFISTRGDASYVVIGLAATEEESVGQLAELRAKITPPAGIRVELTGYAPMARDQADQSEADLRRAETVSLPFALLVLVGVFASFLAAGLPLLVAGLAIPTALALVHVVAEQRQMSIYVLNVATMLGLSLAIDYSLFMVSRFREELGNGRTVAEAVERTVATSGKAVLFSGVAVAIGLSGLVLFRAPALASFGLGGSLVVLASLFYALTFVPAVLGILGPRVNALSVGGSLRFLGRVLGRPPREAPAERAGRWERVARGVMAHPVLVLTPVLALLLVVGTPFFRMSQGVPGPAALPAGLESRDAWVTIRDDFPAGAASSLVVLADVRGDPFAGDNALALARYAERLAGVQGIGRVQSPFSGLVDPATGQTLGAAQTAALWALPAERRPPQLAALKDAYVRGSVVRFDLSFPFDPVSPQATDLVPRVRAVDPGGGISVEVGGAAALGRDFLATTSERMPWVVAWTLFASGLVLYLLFGSVVLPLKAVLMTLLSITASFGALVWIFQEGNLAGLLGFETLGYTLAGIPVIMFCTLFGLSMDYEVLLLSRIQEAYRRTGDNTASVAEGLAKTARVITGAALIMVSVFLAFALAEVITIKSLGIGMAIAVFLDATIVRVLLVPAAMRLMGHWNWWAPGPLGRLADRLGFSHVETEGPAERGGPGTAAGGPGTAAPAKA